MGGYHCFDGIAGDVMYGAQIGVVVGLLCSCFGTGPLRITVVLLTLMELGACFRQGLVH